MIAEGRDGKKISGQTGQRHAILPEIGKGFGGQAWRQQVNTARKD